MNNNEQDARQRIIDAALEMLDEVDDISKITIRQIATRANVGVGLINYHFKTKDNLLSIAVGDTMAKTATDFIKSDHYASLSPDQKIKTMLKELYGLAGQHENLIQFTLKHALLNGDMDTPLYLVPILRELFDGRKDDMELRIIALQILYPIQVTRIHLSAFRLYSGIDLTNEEQRNHFIDTLIDNIMGPDN